MTVSTFDPTAIVQGGIDELSSTLSGVAPAALVLGAGVLALTFGWSLVRRFI